MAQMYNPNKYYTSTEPPAPIGDADAPEVLELKGALNIGNAQTSGYVYMHGRPPEQYVGVGPYASVATGPPGVGQILTKLHPAEQILLKLQNSDDPLFAA